MRGGQKPHLPASRVPRYSSLPRPLEEECELLPHVYRHILEVEGETRSCFDESLPIMF